MLVKMFHGFCMALADSVPGVSGGTVAFILGFYEKFIDALHGLFGKDNGARKVAVLYLAKLGVGWCLGLCLSVVALNDLFQTKTYFLSSLFLGLTAAAFPSSCAPSGGP
ncbi:MAG: undecaprenyl phosphate translocase family protein [Evtepia gabavorous]